MQKKIFLFALMSLFLFVACNKEDAPDPKPTPDVTVPAPDPEPDSEPTPVIPVGVSHYMTFTTQKGIGETIDLYIETDETAQKDTCWVDLNNNGEKDPGEEYVFDGEQEYEIGSQIITVFGKI